MVRTLAAWYLFLFLFFFSLQQMGIELPGVAARVQFAIIVGGFFFALPVALQLAILVGDHWHFNRWGLMAMIVCLECGLYAIAPPIVMRQAGLRFPLVWLLIPWGVCMVLGSVYVVLATSGSGKELPESGDLNVDSSPSLSGNTVPALPASLTAEEPLESTDNEDRGWLRVEWYAAAEQTPSAVDEQPPPATNEQIVTDEVPPESKSSSTSES